MPVQRGGGGNWRSLSGGGSPSSFSSSSSSLSNLFSHLSNSKRILLCLTVFILISYSFIFTSLHDVTSPSSPSSPPSSPPPLLSVHEASIPKFASSSSISSSRWPSRTNGVFALTGGLGAIGQIVVRQLLAIPSSEPLHVRRLIVFDVSEPSSTFLQQDPRLKFIRGDLRDRQSVETLLKEGVEGVLHLAAMSRVVWCEFKKTECIESNVDGTQVLLSSMLEAISPFSSGEEGQRKGEEGGKWTIPWLVFASSREVYGGLKAEDMPVSEETLPKALNVYGQTKVDDEDIIRDARLQPLRSLSGLSSSNKQAEEKPKSGGEDDIYGENEGEEEVSYLTAVILRFSNVYGSIHDHPDRLIPALVRNALRDLPLVIEGGDNKRMDFTNVQDVSRSIIKAAERAKRLQFELSHKSRKPADTQNEHYNIVSGQSTSLMTLAHLILKVVGEGKEEKGQVQQGGRVIATQSDPMFTDAYSALPDKAKKVLGFVAATPLEEGLRVYIKGIRGTDKETLKEKAKKKGCFNSTLLSFSEEEGGGIISSPLGSGDKRPRYPSVSCQDYKKAIQRLEENNDEKERTEEKTSTSPLPACPNDCDLLIRCVNSGSCLCVDDRCPSRFKGFMDSLELSMLGYLSPSSTSSSSSSVELEKEMSKVSNKEVIILGSGPTSLCAAKRLEELGHKKWRLFPNTIVGTNSKEDVGQPLEIERLYSSVKWTDNEGFTWDLGARHPFLSRFKWFDNLLDLILPSTEWIQHYVREEEPSSFVFLKSDLISQPIFYGLDQLSTKESTASCLSDFIGERFKLQQRQNKERGGTQEESTIIAEGEGIEEVESKDKEKSLEEWAITNYGRCLADSFVLPQLKKEWSNAEVFSSSSQQEGQKTGRPILGTSWLDESVSVDLKKVSLSALTGRSTAALSNSLTSNQEQNGFGEQSFRYPLKGSQDFWNKVKAHLPSHQIQSQPVQLSTILLQQKKTGREKNLVKTVDGSQFTFDGLISSLSLDKVLGIVKESSPSSFPYSYYSSLLGKNKQTVLFVGIGVKGNFPPKFSQAKWIDFPESLYPFYRLTLLSNISPHLVPLTNSFSVLAEISLLTEDFTDSQFETKKVELIKATVIALNKCGLIRTDSQILSTFSHVSKHARPIPFLHRDQKLRVLDKNLKKNGIWSRGSFGSWKEEVTEDDMLCLQGVEAVDNILFGGPETVVSKPSLVHSMYRSTLAPVISPEMSLLPASVYFLDWEFAIAKTCEDNLSWLSELLLELFGNQMTALGKFKVFIYEPSACTTESSVSEGGAYWENLNHVHKVSITSPSLEKEEFTTVAYLTHLLSRRGRADEGDISVFLTGDLHRIKADLATTSSSSEGVSSLAKTLRFISKANSLRQHFSYIGGSFTSLDCPTASTQLPEELKGSNCGDLCSIYDIIMRRDGDCPQKITSYQNSGFYISRSRLSQVRTPVFLGALEHIKKKGQRGAKEIGFLWHAIFYEPDNFTPYF